MPRRWGRGDPHEEHVLRAREKQKIFIYLKFNKINLAVKHTKTGKESPLRRFVSLSEGLETNCESHPIDLAKLFATFFGHGGGKLNHGRRDLEPRGLLNFPV